MTLHISGLNTFSQETIQIFTKLSFYFSIFVSYIVTSLENGISSNLCLCNCHIRCKIFKENIFQVSN
jgi:hypothetical protein